MCIRIGINGVGRIGKFVLLSALKEKRNIKIVAINDIVPIEYLAYILKYDSVHGILKNDIRIEQDNFLVINGQKIKVTNEKNPINLNWSDLNVQYVIESTGHFLTKNLASYHLSAGAKKVILSAPPKDNNIPMFVMGVNNKNISIKDDIISNASCTTNCLSPIVKILNDNFGILQGLVTTIHASTATQKVVDGISYRDWKAGRSAITNIIPSTTGAANAVGKIIPELDGKLTGMAFRVPITDVSVLDFTVCLKIPTDYQSVKQCIKNESENSLKGILGYTDDPVVSTDFIGDKRISIFDSDSSIMLNPTFLKVIAWYDNEIGYSNKILDLLCYINTLK